MLQWPVMTAIACNGAEEVPLPVGPLALRVSLVEAGGFICGQWAFAPRHSTGRSSLRVDLTTLDPGSVMLIGGEGTPVADEVTPFKLPKPGAALSIVIENYATWPPAQGRLEVKLAPADAHKTRARWSQALTAPAQWFYVEITTFCNLECPFCPSKELIRPRQHMSLDLARTVFRKIAAYLNSQELRDGYVQYRPMVFLHVMGEPVLHPQLTRIIAEAHEAGLAVGLFTNATLLNAKNIAKLVNAAPELVTLSLNSVEEAGYRALGTKDSLSDQHARVVAYLEARAANDCFATSVDIQYMTSAGRLVCGDGLLRRRETAWALFERWQGKVRALHRNRPVSARSFPLADATELVDPLSQRSDPSLRIPLGHGICLVIKSGCSFGNAVLPKDQRVIPTTRGYCPFNSPFQQMAIFVDGSVSFCNLDHENTVSLGSLNDSEIDEIWTSARLNRIRAEMSQGIVSEPVCQRCLGDVVACTPAETQLD